MQRPHPPNSRPPPAYGVVRNSNPSRIYIQSIPLALRCENDSLQITTHCKAWHCMNKLQHATPPCVGTIAESSKSMFHYRMMWLCCAGVAWPRPPRAGNDDASTGCSWRATSAGRCTHGRAHAGSHAHVLCAAWSHGAPWHAASRVHAHGMGAGAGAAPTEAFRADAAAWRGPAAAPARTCWCRACAASAPICALLVHTINHGMRHTVCICGTIVHLRRKQHLRGHEHTSVMDSL